MEGSKLCLLSSFSQHAGPMRSSPCCQATAQTEVTAEPVGCLLCRAKASLGQPESSIRLCRGNSQSQKESNGLARVEKTRGTSTLQRLETKLTLVLLHQQQGLHITSSTALSVKVWRDIDALPALCLLAILSLRGRPTSHQPLTSAAQGLSASFKWPVSESLGNDRPEQPAWSIRRWWRGVSSTEHATFCSSSWCS